MLLPLAAAGAVLATGCSDDEDKGEDNASTTPKTVPVEESKPGTRKGKSETDGGKKGKTIKAQVSEAELEKERRAARREATRDRKEDRQFDREFSETGFEKLVADLPVRKPPLFVEQYITEQGSSTVYTAVAPKRFFCGRSAAQRKAAVERFYRDADRLFRRGGVKDFVQIVTPIAETTADLPALARGRNGSVSLSKRGRATGPC